MPVTNIQLCASLQCKLKQKFLLCHSKLIKYIFSAVSVCSNSRVGRIPKTNMSFFLLSMSAEKLIPTPKINTF